MRRSNLAFYDGECGLCTRSVRFLRRMDSKGVLHFEPLTSPAGEALLAAHPELLREDSLIWVSEAPVGIHLRSEAVRLMLLEVEGLGRRLGQLLGWVPRPLRDGVYRAVAKNRHRIPGFDAPCPLP
jgi:predicted DCC family thiol-disulfide oxidoreductase YuxK